MATLLSPRPQRSRNFLPAAVIFSILLHLLLLALLGRSPLGVEPPPREIVVALQPAEEPPAPPPPGAMPQAPGAPPQVVAPSDRENNQVPDGRAFLSDRNNRVDQETVARGIPNPGRPDGVEDSAQVPDAAPTAETAAPADSPAASQDTGETTAPPADALKTPPEVPAEQESAEAETRDGSGSLADVPSERAPTSDVGTRPAPRKLPGLDTLLAPPSKVLGKRSIAPSARAPQAQAPQAENDPNRDLLRAPPPPRGLLSGLRGTYDALPDVAAGNLTLLNTKADRFAPFVRRVGTRVFENLLIEQRKTLDANEIIAARTFTTIRAILDTNGRLRDLEIVDRSGSQAMDGTLLAALREAAFDPNPPPAAANADGEFEFIFRAQVVAGVTQGARGPTLQRVESRLQVGLN